MRMDYPLRRNLRLTRPSPRWLTVVLGLTLASGILVLSGSESLLRSTLALAFLLICPGWPFVRFLRLRDISTEIVLVVALSIALDGIVSAIMLYTGNWSSPLIHVALIYITLIGVRLNMLGSARRPRRVSVKRLLSRYSLVGALVVFIVVLVALQLLAPHVVLN